MNLYKEVLMDHYKNPRNYGKLENPDIDSGEYNPSCGDRVEIQGMIDQNKMLKLYFTGKGCVISQAMASILTQWCVDKNIDDLLSISEDKILNLLSFPTGPNRSKCALLPLYALRSGLTQYCAKRINRA